MMADLLPYATAVLLTAIPAWALLNRIGLSHEKGLVSVGVSDTGIPVGKPALAYDKPFGQSDPIARDYTIAPDGRPFIVEPSERRPGVTHLCVVTNWYQLLK